MNILFLDWKCFCKEETIEAFEKRGHKVFLYAHKNYQSRKSDVFENDTSKFIKENTINMAFSYNYYPVLAECCKNNDIKYVSFLYDNPYVMLYSYTLMYPTNYIFLFDKSQYLEFKNGGLNNVYYMILPSDSKRYERQMAKGADIARLTSDISFLGQLYNEEHDFYGRIEAARDEYLNGYLNGLIESQLKISGYSFIDELLTPEILERMKEAYPYEVQSKGVEPDTYAYANYFVARKATSIERTRLLSAIGERFPNQIKLYTWDSSVKMDGVQNMGIADYDSEMAVAFHNSKINLNISLRSIKTGIPLRCMDIMGSGGFLLSNYQQDLVEAFIPGEEFVYYEDQEDLLDKIDYLLTHESERKEIAQNGQRKVLEEYSFDKVFGRIFEIVEE